MLVFAELEGLHEIAKSIVPMTFDEASAIVSSFASESGRLQETIAEKMSAEDYDACDALQVNLDALEAKHIIAQKIAGGGGAPAAVASMAAAAPPESMTEGVPALSMAGFPRYCRTCKEVFIGDTCSKNHLDRM